MNKLKLKPKFSIKILLANTYCDRGLSNPPCANLADATTVLEEYLGTTGNVALLCNLALSNRPKVYMKSDTRKCSHAFPFFLPSATVLSNFDTHSSAELGYRNSISASFKGLPIGSNNTSQLRIGPNVLHASYFL